MPLAVGNTWTYEVRGRALTQVADMRVSRKIAVDDLNGFELSGPLGADRLAWRGPKLIAESLGGTHYLPPITLLDARIPKAAELWSGSVTSPTRSSEGTASLTHVTTDTMVGSRKTPAVETILELRAGKRVLELDTWFVSGIGIVKQEERSDDVETVRLSRMFGP